MKTRIILFLSIAALSVLVGCYRFPSKRGHWTGEIGTKRLYTWEGEEHDCATLVIKTGPTSKDLDAKEAVLVNKDGRCYSPQQFKSHTVRVDGVLTSDFPIDQRTGQYLVMHKKNQQKAIENEWIIKVRRLEQLP